MACFIILCNFGLSRAAKRRIVGVLGFRCEILSYTCYTPRARKQYNNVKQFGASSGTYHRRGVRARTATDLQANIMVQATLDSALAIISRSSTETGARYCFAVDL